MAQEMNFFYAHRDSRLLYHIDQALEKIERGKYGQCETCSRPIGRNRLEAVPHARLCVECKSNEELDEANNQVKDLSLDSQDEY